MIYFVIFYFRKLLWNMKHYITLGCVKGIYIYVYIYAIYIHIGICLYVYDPFCLILFSKINMKYEVLDHPWMCQRYIYICIYIRICINRLICIYLCIYKIMYICYIHTYMCMFMCIRSILSDFSFENYYEIWSIRYPLDGSKVFTYIYI
jgi:hypothetical protein